MATSSAPSRETRRRKIVDRGADRLALITGQIRTINPTPDPEPDRDSDSSPPPPDSLPTAHPIQSSVSSDEKTGGDFSPALQDPSPVDAGGIVEEEPVRQREPVHEKERSIKAMKAPSESDGISRSYQPSMPSVLAPVGQRSDDRDLSVEKPVQRRRRVNMRASANEVISAIADTEESRRLCTVAVAVFVVFSNWGVPLLGSFLIRGIISFRPLYLVLLTNVMIVVARIFLDEQRSEQPSRQQPKNPSNGEVDWIEQAGKALEATLVMQKAIDALLLDFSVYAVIVVCGLSI